MIENATSAASIQSMLRTMAAYQSEAAGTLQGLNGQTALQPNGQVAKPAAPGFSNAVEQALERPYLKEVLLLMEAILYFHLLLL